MSAHRLPAFRLRVGLLLGLAFQLVWLGWSTPATPVSAAPRDYAAFIRQMSPGMDTPEVVRVISAVFEQDTGAGLDTLTRLVESGDVPKNQMDEVVHLIGMSSYLKYNDPGIAYDHCRIDFGWGCYHGVTMAYVATLGANFDASALKSVCEEKFYRASGGGRVGASCWHALGHGIAPALGYDIPKSLSYCDVLVVEGQSNCWAGVFAQSVDDALRGTVSGYLRPSDELWPCNTLPEKYLSTCYREQITALVKYHPSGLTEVARACGGVPVTYRPDCYDGLGRVIQGYGTRVLSESLARCASFGAPIQDACDNGVLGQDITAIPQNAVLEVCKGMTDELQSHRCYLMYGLRLYLDSPQIPRLKQDCSAIDSRFYLDCARGANLSSATDSRVPSAVAQLPPFMLPVSGSGVARSSAVTV